TSSNVGRIITLPLGISEMDALRTCRVAAGRRFRIGICHDLSSDDCSRIRVAVRIVLSLLVDDGKTGLQNRKENHFQSSYYGEHGNQHDYGTALQIGDRSLPVRTVLERTDNLCDPPG